MSNRIKQVVSAYSMAFLVLPVLAFVLLSSGCAKDYSYEYSPADSADTSAIPPATTVSCAVCSAATLPNFSWRMTIGSSVYCGKVEKGVVSPERTGFTFFGPSDCSADSGFVVTVYLSNSQLSGDRANIEAKMSCYYYDKIGPSHVYISSASAPLQLVVTSYQHQTGIITGSFRGTVVDIRGKVQVVKDGRFHTRL